MDAPAQTDGLGPGDVASVLCARGTAVIPNRVHAAEVVASDDAANLKPGAG